MGKSNLAYVILNHKPPKGFKQTVLPKYDALAEDPSDHRRDFEKQLILYDYDALKCNLFPTTLNGEAAKWFSKLSSHSFWYWLDFRLESIFRHYWSKPKKVDYLFGIK